MSNRALITGITGQDGSYLAELLLDKGYEVYGLARRTSNNPLTRIEHLKDRVVILRGNMRDIGTLERALKDSKPDEVYNLAAQSDVGVSFECPEETYEVNYLGLERLVDAALCFNSDMRMYQASTSEMFGSVPPPQNEHTPFCPVSPYGKAKLKAHTRLVEYRTRHKFFICSGILFNHESPRRGEHFVTRKITRSLVKIALELQDSFELGNLDARRDWGFAGDYVEAMWKMLQLDTPEDFVIATGRAHTVREFVEATARVLDIRITWEGSGVNEVGRDRHNDRVLVRVNPKFYRPAEVYYLQGDSAKALCMLGWRRKTPFESLVQMMVEYDYNDLARTMRR